MLDTIIALIFWIGVPLGIALYAWSPWEKKLSAEEEAELQAFYQQYLKDN